MYYFYVAINLYPNIGSCLFWDSWGTVLGQLGTVLGSYWGLFGGYLEEIHFFWSDGGYGLSNIHFFWSDGGYGLKFATAARN